MVGHLKDQEGQALAEAAIVLTLFMLILLGLYDLFNIQTTSFKSLIAARNSAWKNRQSGSVMDVLGNVGKQLQTESLSNVVFQTQHGLRDTVFDSTLFVLPAVKVRVNSYVDKETWDTDISLTGLIKKIKGIFD